MGYKTIVLAAAVFSAAYAPARRYEVSAMCAAVPTKTVADAQAMLPVPQSFWDYVNGIAAGNFGAPPTSPPFRRVWDLERAGAAQLSLLLSEGNADTFAGVCGYAGPSGTAASGAPGTAQPAASSGS